MFEAGTGWLLDDEGKACLDMIWFCPVTFAYDKGVWDWGEFAWFFGYLIMLLQLQLLSIEWDGEIVMHDE